MMDEQGEIKSELPPGPALAGLDEAQRLAYNAALLASGITLSNYQSLTGRSLAASKQDLALLVELGFFERQGRGRSAVYVSAYQQESRQQDSIQGRAGSP